MNKQNFEKDGSKSSRKIRPTKKKQQHSARWELRNLSNKSHSIANAFISVSGVAFYSVYRIVQLSNSNWEWKKWRILCGRVMRVELKFKMENRTVDSIGSHGALNMAQAPALPLIASLIRRARWHTSEMPFECETLNPMRPKSVSIGFITRFFFFARSNHSLRGWNQCEKRERAIDRATENEIETAKWDEFNWIFIQVRGKLLRNNFEKKSHSHRNRNQNRSPWFVMSNWNSI